MKLQVYLLDTKTGKQYVYQTDDDYPGKTDFSFNEFIWSEGNYSCDCNRSLFCQRASGMDEMSVLKSGYENELYSDCNVGPNHFRIEKIVEEEKMEILYAEATP